MEVRDELAKYVFRMSEVSLGLAVGIIGAISYALLNSQTLSYSRILMLLGIIALATSVFAAFLALVFQAVGLWNTPAHQDEIRSPLSEPPPSEFKKAQRRTDDKVRNYLVASQVGLMIVGSMLVFTSIWQ